MGNANISHLSSNPLVVGDSNPISTPIVPNAPVVPVAPVNLEMIKLQNQIKSQDAIIQTLRTQIQSATYIENNQHTNVSPKDQAVINQFKSTLGYEYLVFSGGSIKATAYAGALDIIDSKNILPNIKGFAGTSAGSIVASLLAVGYTSAEMKQLLLSLDFEKLLTDNDSYIREAYNFIDGYGLCSGDYLESQIGSLIAAKTGNENYTLEDLMKDKNIKLVIVTTNMQYKKTMYLYAGNPIPELSNIPIKKAVRMSTSIPILFEPVEYVNNGNTDYFVDGGVLDNYPLHVFDGAMPGDPKAILGVVEPNPKVLGLCVMTESDLADFTTNVRQDITSETDYFTSFINIFLTHNEKRIMTPSFWLRSIIIVTPNYSLTQIDLTDQQKQELVSLGSKYANQFFANQRNINIVN